MDLSKGKVADELRSLLKIEFAFPGTETWIFEVMFSSAEKDVLKFIYISIYQCFKYTIPEYHHAISYQIYKKFNEYLRMKLH